MFKHRKLKILMTALLLALTFVPSAFSSDNNDKDDQLEPISADHKFDFSQKTKQKGMAKNSQQKLKRNLRPYTDDFQGVDDIFENMKKMFKSFDDSFFGGNQLGQGRNLFDLRLHGHQAMGNTINIERSETENELKFKIKLKNVNKESLKINIDENAALKISGEMKKETKQEDENGNVFRSYSSSTFSQTLPLPKNADPSSLKIQESKDQLTLVFKKR
ncbi:MAG: Hsp20/alpha crystallin family protein [Bacteriovoracaceae bacterium]